MKKFVLSLGMSISLALAITACSSDDKKTTSQPTAGASKAAAAAKSFCTDYQANGGRETTIRPVPQFGTKEQILDVLNGALNAIGDITPPAPISAQWASLKKSYTSLLAEVQQLPAGGKFSAKRQKSLAAEMQSLFTTSSKDVINYILANCK